MLKKIYKLTLILVLFITLHSPAATSASSQTVSLNATQNYGNPIVSNFLENYKIETEALSSTQTAITPEESFVYYTWSLDLISDLPCPDATLQNIKLRASNDSTTEGDPDWSQIGLYTNDGVETTMLDLIIQPVAEGTSATGLPYIARNNGSLFGSYDIGINGPMEGVWDLSAYSIANPIGIVVTHDAEDGTVGLQTTLESIEVTYNTTSCDPVSPVVTSVAPKSPKTGDAVSIMVSASAATALTFLILKTAKKLKSQH